MSFDRLAFWLASQLGKPRAFFGALAVIVVLHVAAAVPAWNETILLWSGAETGFLGVLTTLLLLGGQLRESLATQAKLDEAIFVNEHARNELIGIEARTAEEIAALRRKVD